MAVVVEALAPLPEEVLAPLLVEALAPLLAEVLAPLLAEVLPPLLAEALGWTLETGLGSQSRRSHRCCWRNQTLTSNPHFLGLCVHPKQH